MPRQLRDGGRDEALALGWGGCELCHGMAQTRGGGEGGSFFSLESFKLHCHDCFYLKKKKGKKVKKKEKKKKQNKTEKLL